MELQFSAKAHLGDFTLDAKFFAPEGQVTVLFGRSGEGKSSIIDAIAGLLPLTEGKIILGERLLFDSGSGINLKPEKRRVGYVFQDSKLFPHLSVKRNLLYGRRFAPEFRHSPSLDEVIELLGIDNLLKRFPTTLSGGERQRVAIGRSLLAGADILLMDEPLASLDIKRKNEVLNYIGNLKTITKLPIIYVTHSVEEVLKLADKVALVSKGKVQAYGSPAEVMGRPDLDPFITSGAGGTIVDATICDQDDDFSLTKLSFQGGQLLVPRLNLSLGTKVRVRIRSRDVALAICEPKSISILNIFPAYVVSIRESHGAAVDVVLDAGIRLRAQVTKKSIDDLSLKKNMKVFALVKTVAVEGHEYI